MMGVNRWKKDGEAAALLRLGCVVGSQPPPSFPGWGQAGDSSSDPELG